MLPSNTIRFIQNTIHSTESHNRRLDADQIWKQTDTNSRSNKTKTKRKRKRSKDIDNDWYYQQQIRQKNSKRRKSNLESIMLGKWDHDKYDRKQDNNCKSKPIKTKKTIFDALESLKTSKKQTKSRKKQIESEPNDSDSDNIDLSQCFKKHKRHTSNAIIINIKQKKSKDVNINIIEDLSHEYDPTKEKSKHSGYKKSKKKKKKRTNN